MQPVSSRGVSEFCNRTDELVAEYELASFGLKKFQVGFKEPNQNNPMFDAYVITEANLPFLKKYPE